MSARDEELVKNVVRISQMAGLATGSAESCSHLLESIVGREVADAKSNANALIIVTSARNVLRVAIAVQKNVPVEGLSALDDAIQIFQAEYPNIRLARDLVEHADEYLSGRGRRSPEEYFDTRHFGSEERPQFTVGKHDFDLVDLCIAAKRLAAVVDQYVRAWFNLEVAFSKIDDQLEAFGISGSVRISRSVVFRRLGDSNRARARAIF